MPPRQAMDADIGKAANDTAKYKRDAVVECE
jgi:hypothetical protein